MTDTLLGRRRDGRPFYLIRGGAEADDDLDGALPVTGGAAPAPPVEDMSALRAELEAMRAENAATKAAAEQSKAAAAQSEERLRALMAGGGEQPPAATDEDDDEDPKDATGKPADPEMAKLQRALRAANRESKARREQADKLRADWEAQDKARQEQLAEAQRLSEAADKARQEAEARYKPATIRAAALPALLDAGASKERAERLVKLMDIAKMDVDASGAVTGLAEQVAAVKAEWPELFIAAEPERRPVPRVNGGDRPPAEQQSMRSADRIVAGVLSGDAA